MRALILNFNLTDGLPLGIIQVNGFWEDLSRPDLMVFLIRLTIHCLTTVLRNSGYGAERGSTSSGKKEKHKSRLILLDQANVSGKENKKYLFYRPKML